MGWRDTLQTASFRGVPFYYDGVTSTVGRRSVVHEFPGRDDAEVEDLGRLAVRFELDAWLVGDDYDTQRDRLVAAFETAGPGELVHPYWGTRRVALAGDIKITESPREGGLARVTVSVVEVGERAPTARAVDTAANVAAAADDAVAELELVAIPGLAMTDLIEQTVDAAQVAVEAGFTKLREAKTSINSALNLGDDGIAALLVAADEVADIIRSPTEVVELVVGKLAEVFTSVSTVAEGVADLIALGQDLELPYSFGPASQASRSDVLMAAWRIMDTFDADGVTALGTASQGAAQAAQLAFIIRMFRIAAVIEATRATSELTFDSFDRAFSVLDELTAAIDDLAADATEDGEYQRLVDLRAAFALHIQTTAADLPHIVEHTPPSATPALVLAHELYGDSTMAEDIIARNGVRNPQVVPGGVTLQVLSS